MPVQLQTFEQVVIILQFLAGAGGGIVASLFFDWLRERVSFSDPGLAAKVLHSPRYARFVVLTLTFLIGTAAAVAIAYLTAGDPGKVLDVAVAGFLGQLFAQLRHALTSLPAEPSVSAYIFTPEAGSGDSHAE
jgi:hypothetical protein